MIKHHFAYMYNWIKTFSVIKAWTKANKPYSDESRKWSKFQIGGPIKTFEIIPLLMQRGILITHLGTTMERLVKTSIISWSLKYV